VLATAIIDAAALSFLGLGNPDDRSPEWGQMLGNAQPYFDSHPHLAVYPALCIIVVALGFDQVGLDQVLDPGVRVDAGGGEDLFLPPGDGAKLPAVVLLHGSGGVYDALLNYWPKQFNAAGMAVFVLDMFGPRGVQSTAEDQSSVPFVADVADSFAALRLLATHPRIDSKRIALMGFSRGGSATLRANVTRIIAAQRLPDGLRYAAFIPTYAGGCVGVFRLVVRSGVFTPAPMLFIHGDADDYTPIGPCLDYADKIGRAGTPVQFVTLAGARHKFDADDQRRHQMRNAVRIRPDCTVETDIDTLTAHDGNWAATARALELDGGNLHRLAKRLGLKP